MTITGVVQIDISDHPKGDPYADWNGIRRRIFEVLSEAPRGCTIRLIVGSTYPPRDAFDGDRDLEHDWEVVGDPRYVARWVQILRDRAAVSA